MLFTTQWASNHYFNPLKSLTQRIYYPPSPPPIVPIYNPTYNPAYNPTYDYPPQYNFNSYDNEELCCCTIF